MKLKVMNTNIDGIILKKKLELTDYLKEKEPEILLSLLLLLLLLLHACIIFRNIEATFTLSLLVASLAFIRPLVKLGRSALINLLERYALKIIPVYHYYILHSNGKSRQQVLF